MCEWIIGCHISTGICQPPIDNRLQCTVSWIGLNGFMTRTALTLEAVRRRANNKGELPHSRPPIINDCWSKEEIAWSHQRQIGKGICMGIICRGEQFLKTWYDDIRLGRMSGAVSGKVIILSMDIWLSLWRNPTHYSPSEMPANVKQRQTRIMHG